MTHGSTGLQANTTTLAGRWGRASKVLGARKSAQDEQLVDPRRCYDVMKYDQMISGYANFWCLSCGRAVEAIAA